MSLKDKLMSLAKKVTGKILKHTKALKSAFKKTLKQAKKLPIKTFQTFQKKVKSLTKQSKKYAKEAKKQVGQAKPIIAEKVKNTQKRVQNYSQNTLKKLPGKLPGQDSLLKLQGHAKRYLNPLTQRKLSKCHCVADFRTLASRRLPAPMFHYIDGAAEDEWTYQRNTSAFQNYALIPHFLVNVDKINTQVKVLGQTLDWPFLCSPTGYHRLFHPDGEIGVAKAAAKNGTLFCLSTLATSTIEEVAAASTGPKMFQIYVLKDRGLSQEYVQRCKDANYDALCLTIDVPVNGKRERDLKTGMTVPPKLSLNSYLNIAMHWDWSFNYLSRPAPQMANIIHRLTDKASDISVMEFMNQQFDRTVTWKDAAWLIKQWDKPFAIKGIMSVADAKRAVEVGATAIIVSNHGGRQMDGCPAPIEVLEDIVNAVGDKVEVILDGGIRRGSHILKALALGATACMGGRAYLYGLAGGGENGAYQSLEILKEEFRNNLMLLGCNRLNQIKAKQHLRAL